MALILGLGLCVTEWECKACEQLGFAKIPLLYCTLLINNTVPGPVCQLWSTGIPVGLSQGNDLYSV